MAATLVPPLMWALVVAAATAAAPPTVSTRHIAVGGYNRSFELQEPGTPGGGRLAVILSFHGDGGSAGGQAADDHFRDVAGELALVVHGQGIGTEQATGKHHPTWNGGGASM